MTRPAPLPARIADAAPLADEELRSIDAYWRAANYLSVGQIYLLDNPLLRRPLEPDDIALVRLGPDDPLRHPATGAIGSVKAGDLRPGVWMLQVHPTSGHTLEARFDVVPGESEVRLRLVQQRGGVLEGTVVLDPAARACLLAQPWPGNVRQLRTVLRTLVALSEDGHIGLDELPAECRGARLPLPSSAAPVTVDIIVTMPACGRSPVRSRSSGFSVVSISLPWKA